MSAVIKQKKNEECVFDGYIHDIKKAFTSVYGREANGDDSELLVSTLHAVINSYYFEGLYEYSKVGISDDNQYFLKVLPNKNLEKYSFNIDGKEVLLADYTKKVLGESRRRMPTISELPISLFTENVDFEIGQIQLSPLDEIFISDRLDISLIIKKMKEINPDVYNILFEENEVKQTLILKNKKDLDIEVIPVNELSNYLIQQLKIQSVNNQYDFLNANYDLRYFVKQNSPTNSNDFVVILKNKLEIAGLAVVNESNEALNSLKSLGQESIEYSKRFMKVSSVMVSKNYRGQGLGVQLFDKVIEEANKNDFIIIRSEASDLGRNFLKRNIDTLTEKYSVPVINAEWFTPVSSLLPNMFKQGFIKGKENLTSVLSEIKEFDKHIHEKKMTASSSQDFFAIEDEESDFKIKLAQRKFDKKSSKLSI